MKTTEELRKEYGVYFDTFQLCPFFPEEQRARWFNDGEITEEGYECFIKWVKGLKSFESLSKQFRPKKYPIINNGKALCPICGNEIKRSPESELPRYAIYHYFCTQCDYRLMTHLIFKEAEVFYFDYPEDYDTERETNESYNDGPSD